MPKQRIEYVVFQWIAVFTLSFYLFQALEDHILSTPDFIFKNLILLIIPAPQDSLIELLQFLFYWLTFGFVAFKAKK